MNFALATIWHERNRFLPGVLAVAFSALLIAIQFGVLLAVNMQTSFLHPPFGFALFYLRSIAPKEVKSSAIYWGAAAIVAIIGFIARMKYRDRNLKRLLDAYVEKAKRADGHER
jgi:TRAP-type mannitol/chloroaromatic compound transport system permease large subunit